MATTVFVVSAIDFIDFLNDVLLLHYQVFMVMQLFVLLISFYSKLFVLLIYNSFYPVDFKIVR